MSAPASVPSSSVSRPSRRRIAPPVQREAVQVGPRHRHRVGDEEDAVRPALRRQRQPASTTGATWIAVRDQPRPHPLGVERRPDQSRLAVAELAHGVEEMRHHPRAGREGRRRLRRAGVAVPEAHHRPRRRQRRDLLRRDAGSGATVTTSTGSRPRRVAEEREVRLRPSAGSAAGHAPPCAGDRDAAPRGAARESPAPRPPPPRRPPRPPRG